MGKFKPHKGLLKRVRITKSGKVKMSRASSRHLRSGKPSDTLRSYRRPRYSRSKGILARVTQLVGHRVHSAAKPEASAETAKKD
ncbi:MAG TPA: bL35 family ribosomal protein [Phycisphaerales bacterium]|nr:bL35 family ribosomal protein [Phycisphaerales bacterium]